MLKGRDRDIYQERSACPLYTAIGVIQGRWKPMIYQRISERPHGFGELKRAMPKITTRVLRQQLRELCADGILTREQLAPAMLGVRYRVTPYGRTLGPLLEALWRWGRAHLDRPETAAGTRIRAPRAVAE
jgi:DNA-binding HxlR family transcriptional regulator